VDNQKEIFGLIEAVSGQLNLLVVPRIFIEMTGDIETALIISQCIYWSSRSRAEDGWFWKTTAEFADEVAMGDYKFRSAVKRLVVMGLLETKIKKANGNPTTHYKPNLEEIANRIITISQNRFRDNRENDIAIPAKSLTDTTTEITTNMPVVENEDKPAEETDFLVGDESQNPPVSTWEIIGAGREVKNPRVLEAIRKGEMERRAGGVSDYNPSWLYESLWGLHNAFVKATGREALPSERVAWTKFYLEWQTQQVKVEEIHAAVGKLRQSGITIGSPRSLTKTILDMRAVNRTSAKRISTTDFTESEGDDYAG